MNERRLGDSDRTKFWLDLMIALAILALSTVPLTGIVVHEWLGVIVVVPLVTHLLLNWKWIAATTRRFFRRMGASARIRFLLDWLLFVFMTIVIFTGVMISESLLPSLGLRPGFGPFWRALHSWSATALVVIVALHLALNWPWISRALRRRVLGPTRDRLLGSSRVAPPASGAES
jgi:hypothetical protein